MRVRLANNYIKQLVATMFAVAFILLGVCIGSDDAKQVYAAEVTTTTHASGKFVYATYADKEEVKNYLGNSAPGTKEGYLFAGWYTDEDCTQTIKNAKEVDEASTNTFYAKYVPENVLSTKVQISLNDINTTDEYDTRNMRFVSSVDDLTYGQVGFALKYQEKGSTTWRTFKNEGTYVFSRIVAAAGNDEYKFSPKVVDTKSEYFITATWKGADHNGLINDTSEGALTDFNTGYYVRAYWVTMDGVTVYGPVRYVSVNDGLNTNIINVAVKGATTKSGSVEVSGYDGATGTVAYHDGTYSHVRIDLGTGKDRSDVLKSVTRFTVDGKTVDYRNLYTKYTGSGTEDTSWYDVYGNKAGEYVIATSADLYGFVSVVNTPKFYFLLGDVKSIVYMVADIEVNKGTASPTGWSLDYSEDGVTKTGTDYKWTGIGTGSNVFKGIFDGQGHTISGINGTNGLFYNSYSTTEIKNVNLTNTYLVPPQNGSGSIVSLASGGKIENVRSDAFINNTSRFWVGGIVGAQNTANTVLTMQDCSYSGTITTAKAATGGIIGKNTYGAANITNCGFSGSINATVNEIGGLVGTNATTLTITACKSSGSIETTGTMSGGLVGQNTSSLTITGCESSGSIETSSYQSGGLVGQNTSSLTITDCRYSGSIETKDTQSGGLVGTSSSSLTITDCLFDGEITFNGTSGGLKAIGGLVGKNYGSTFNITNSLNSGTLTNAPELAITGVCRLVGYNEHENMKLDRVYYTNEGFNGTASYASKVTVATSGIEVARKDVIGNLAFFNTALFKDSDRWALVLDDDTTEVDESSTPVLKTFADKVPNEPEIPENVDVDWYIGVYNKQFTICNNDDNDANVKELYGLAYLVNQGITTFATSKVTMQNDVTVNSDTVEAWEEQEFANLIPWIPIGVGEAVFAGTFDGGNHTISGIYISSSEQGAGVFRSTVSGSTIQNLKLEESYIKSTSKYVGSIVGFCGGNISNVYSDAIVNGQDYSNGGIVGQVYAQNTEYDIQIENCHFAGQVYSKGNMAGGILGTQYNGKAVIKNCKVSGEVKSDIGYAGGILGTSFNGTSFGTCVNVDIIECTNEASISVKSENAGGFIGYMTGGDSTATLENCLNKGKVKAEGNVAGGFIGKIQSGCELVMKYCLNMGEVSGPSYIGSLIGWHVANACTLDFTSVYAADTSEATGTGSYANDDVAVGNYPLQMKNTMIALADITVSSEKTTDDVKTKLEGFDFDSIWSIGETSGSTPELQLN